MKKEIKKDEDGDLGVNLIVNGDFEDRTLSKPWEAFDSKCVAGWESRPVDAKIEIGRGNLYNKRWGNTQVCELDSHGNMAIVQKINLESEKRCLLKLKTQSVNGCYMMFLL